MSNEHKDAFVFWVSISFSSEMKNVFPEVKLLHHTVVLFLIFWGPSILVSMVAAPICIPSNSAQGFPILRILAST